MIISQYLQLLETCNFIDASRLAYDTGYPWNCFISINLENAGIKPKEMSIHVRNSIKKFRKYHVRNGMAFSCGWVLENVQSVGIHVHLIIHRAEKLPMHPMKYYWAVIKIFKIKRTKKILKVMKFWSFQTYEMNIIKVTKYCIKGLRQGAEEEFYNRTGLKIKSSRAKQGTIYGKRIGWTLR